VGALARGRGAALEHSEHALVLLDAPNDGPTDPRITLRLATPSDASRLSRLLATAFDGAGCGPARPVVWGGAGVSPAPTRSITTVVHFLPNCSRHPSLGDGARQKTRALDAHQLNAYRIARARSDL
jgi:hypothetical protein